MGVEEADGRGGSYTVDLCVLFFFSRARSARAFAAKERVQENRPHGR